jgi:phosphatidylglycerophosphatase A
MNKLIASVFGIGYIKGGGTVAAMFTCVALYLMWPFSRLYQPLYMCLIGAIILLLGVYVGNKVERYWGKDNYKVVIDEVAGMWITMLFVPAGNVWLLISGLILFRFFDIVKPLFIRRMEALPAGTGVMMDDVLAGIYANIVLQIIMLLHIPYLH